MKNTTELIGLKFTDRLRQAVTANTDTMQSLLLALCGFFFAQTRILGMPGPFGAALTAAVGFESTLPAGVGAVVGYLLWPKPEGNIGLIIATIIIAGVKLLVNNRRWGRATRAASLLSAATVALAGVVPLTLPTANGYDWVLWFSQVVLAGGTAFFVQKYKAATRLGFEGLSKLQWVSLFVCGGVLAAGLSSISLMGVSLGRILMVCAILAVSYAAGAGAGAALGAAAGFAAGFAGGNFAALVSVYALGGLLAGVFCELGRLGSASAFVITSGFIALSHPEGARLASLLEVFAGSVGFMLLPSPMLRQLGRRISASRENDTLKVVLSARLGATVKALIDICETTRAVSSRLESMSMADISTVYEGVAQRSCKKCSNRTKCWVQYYSDTTDAITASIGRLKSSGRVEAADLPGEFAARCLKPAEFAAAVEQEHTLFAAREGTRRKVSQVRSVVTDQFEGMSMFLSGVRRQLEEVSSADNLIGGRIKEYMVREGLDPSWVVCLTDQYDRMTVRAQMPTRKLARISLSSFASELSELTERVFDLPQTSTEDDVTTLTLWERAAFRVAFGGHQICNGHNSLCGDSYRQFITQGSRAHLVLSDGMGSGGSAAVDSAMASTLIARLAQAELDYDSALKLVNSALLVKSGEESLATVDVATIDLYTGRADFYKAGAAPTVVRKAGRAGSMESTSIPAGILKGVSFEHSGITLREGDIVLLLSDGASAAGVEWIGSELESYKGNDPNELCRKLANAARLRRIDGREDDITVICAMIEKAS